MVLDPTKWRLLLKVLPLLLAFTLVKAILHVLGWEPWTFDLLKAALLAAVTFVTAFLLSGVLGDYNTSRLMPIQIVNSVRAIQDCVMLGCASQPEYNPQPLLAQLACVVDAILDWLQADKPFDAIETQLIQLTPLFAALQTQVSMPIVTRLQIEQGQIRVAVSHIQQIRDVDFLKPANALLECFWIGAIATLLLVHTNTFGEALVIPGLLFLVFTYLLLLILDLENPFQYDGQSSVAIDLAFLEQCRTRLQTALNA
ncbi:MAG: hypothetical protein NW220_19015 [Leptolyngbyaceae cyanobacterium bins.349]|nr:hypothetical protein [Leptolyngbyaceae cyanobacterium bins.349]